MAEIVFTIPYALQSLNKRDRTHWAQLGREKKRLSQEVMVAIGGPRYFPRPPWSHVRITVVRCSAGSLDPDNLSASCKPLLDVLCRNSRTHPTGLSIIEDDNSQRVQLIVRQSKAAPGAGTTVVRIEQIEAAEIAA